MRADVLLFQCPYVKYLVPKFIWYRGNPQGKLCGVWEEDVVCDSTIIPLKKKRSNKVSASS